MTTDPYVPVVHSYWNAHWRVPVWNEGSTYRVCLGVNIYRHYVDETLPKEIKIALAMINAFEPKDTPVYEMNPTDAYINKQDPKLDTIGWRVNKHLYILILSRELIGDMYG